MHAFINSVFLLYMSPYLWYSPFKSLSVSPCLLPSVPPVFPPLLSPSLSTLAQICLFLSKESSLSSLYFLCFFDFLFHLFCFFSVSLSSMFWGLTLFFFLPFCVWCLTFSASFVCKHTYICIYIQHIYDFSLQSSLSL